MNSKWVKTWGLWKLRVESGLFKKKTVYWLCGSSWQNLARNNFRNLKQNKRRLTKRRWNLADNWKDMLKKGQVKTMREDFLQPFVVAWKISTHHLIHAIEIVGCAEAWSTKSASNALDDDYDDELNVDECWWRGFDNVVNMTGKYSGVKPENVV